jgi:glycosyltransferase involved in cell wall biosynthesis
MKIAYVVQNAGFDLGVDTGIPSTIKQTLRHLTREECATSYFELRGRMVNRIDDIDAAHSANQAQLGLTNARAFKWIESGVRRLQGVMNAPYLAMFDSARFYETCLHFLAEFDVCYEHNSLLSVGAALACKQLGKPYVLMVDSDPILELEMQGQSLQGMRRRLAEWEARQTYTIADRVVCLSNVTRQRMIEIWHVPENKIRLIPLAADVESFGRSYDTKAIRASLELGDAPVVAFVGSFQGWHGLENLIDSFASVAKVFPTSKLLLIGDGPARLNVESRVKALNLSDRVVITGLVPHKRIPELLSVADVAVAPYPKLKTEMWFSPLKIYEYMAAGKPIVASRSGQIAEVIRDGENGVLVEPGDTSSFARAMTDLLSDTAKRRAIGMKARETSLNHSWTKFAQTLKSVFIEAIECHR